MKLGAVLAEAGVKSGMTEELAECEVAGLDYDSRRIQPNWLFFAFPGSKTDGREFAREAIERGATATVSDERTPPDVRAPWIQVEHGRRALSAASRRFYDYPDRAIQLTGITGTNGKTTTSFLLDAILRAAGKVTALIGTIEYHIAGRVLPAVNTTPDSLDLCRLLDELHSQKGTHATLEVSSHALELGRVWNFTFHTAVFTNLTQDHLDFHQTMDRYFAAKSLLFNGGNGVVPRFAVVNSDDEYGRKMRTGRETQLISYGLDSEATVRARKLSATTAGLQFELQFGRARVEIKSSLIGRVNAYNILAASAAAMSYGIGPEHIAAGIASCTGVPGRFERVDCGQPFAVVVDYSHTDDALRNALSVARSLHPGRILTVFGCGGDRDRRKRPLMGEAAAEGSDRVFLTSDNPRSEDPLLIMNDVLVGLRRKDTPVIAEPDRATAIRLALQAAQAGDLVLIAGKGHETYQIFSDRTVHFDDREVAREVLAGFGFRKG